MGDAPDPGRCPLCGEPNACALAASDPASAPPCWCREASFPPALLARLPDEARERACICRGCVERFEAER